MTNESSPPKEQVDLEAAQQQPKNKMHSVNSINLTVNFNKDVNPVQYHNTFVIPARNPILTPVDIVDIEQLSPKSSSRSKEPNWSSMTDDFSPSLCNKQ